MGEMLRLPREYVLFLVGPESLDLLSIRKVLVGGTNNPNARDPRVNIPVSDMPCKADKILSQLVTDD